MAWKKPPSQVYYIGCLLYASFFAPCSSPEVLRKQHQAMPSTPQIIVSFFLAVHGYLRMMQSAH